MGMGGEACRNLSQQQIDEIPTEMVTQTLGAYEKIAKNNEKVLTRDPLYALVISPRCPMARWHRMDLRRLRRSMQMAMAFSMTGTLPLSSSSSGATSKPIFSSQIRIACINFRASMVFGLGCKKSWLYKRD